MSVKQTIYDLFWRSTQYYMDRAKGKGVFEHAWKEHIQISPAHAQSFIQVFFSIATFDIVPWFC